MVVMRRPRGGSIEDDVHGVQKEMSEGGEAGAGTETMNVSETETADIADITTIGGARTRTAEAIVDTGLDRRGHQESATNTDIGGLHERTSKRLDAYHLQLPFLALIHWYRLLSLSSSSRGSHTSSMATNARQLLNLELDTHSASAFGSTSDMARAEDTPECQ